MAQVLFGFIFYFNQVIFCQVSEADTISSAFQNSTSSITPNFVSLNETNTPSNTPKDSKNDMFLVHFKGSGTYGYPETKSLYEALKKKGENHMNVSCSDNAGDVALTVGAGLTSSANSDADLAHNSETQSAQSASQGLAFKGKCEVENAELLAEGEAVKKMLNQEKTSCNIAGQADAMIKCNIDCSSSNNKPLCKSSCTEGFTIYNKAQCDKVAIEITQKDSWFMDLLKNHWGTMLGILGLAGAGLMALNYSSEKQKQDFQTNPLASATPTPTAQPASQTQATPVATPTVQTSTDFQSAYDQAYCKTANQPLECLVTPGCDLKCVADKYGVSNYGGMDKDTTRIGRDGRPVDGAAAATGNPGGTNTAGGGGSSASTKGGGVANLSPSSETGATNSFSTRSVSSLKYGDDDSIGGGHGGFDGGGSASDRDPANERYKGAGNSGSTATNGNPVNTGPILPLLSNFFERISNVARTQCVRELLLCNEK